MKIEKLLNDKFSYKEIHELLGHTFNDIKYDDFKITFISDQKEVIFSHEQACCEHVYLEDICGDLENLKNSPITKAEERCNLIIEEKDLEINNKYFLDKGKESYNDDMIKWTFYEIATIKGSVTLRWYGTSNGYYSVDISIFERIN